MTFGGGGGSNYSIAYISETAYCMHLGPSPFYSAPRTLQYMKLSFLGELPLLGYVLHDAFQPGTHVKNNLVFRQQPGLRGWVAISTWVQTVIKS